MSNEKLRNIYRKHELATTGLVFSDFQRIAKDITEALATTEPTSKQPLQVEPAVNQQLTTEPVDERGAFEKWLGIKPCGAAHDFGWSAWQARAAMAQVSDINVAESFTNDTKDALMAGRAYAQEALIRFDDAYGRHPQTEASRLAHAIREDMREWFDGTPRFLMPIARGMSIITELRRLDTAHTVAVELAAQYAAERDQLRAQLSKAVAEEREACAKVCDDRYMGDNNREDMEAKRCAAAIRARSNT